MNLIQRLMGRRQFLIAAGAASTSGLGFKKLAGVFNPVIQTGLVMASDKPAGVAKESGKAGTDGNFSNRYSHLLSPLKIGNVVLKNRMIQTISLPPFMQGPETFPSEQVISHFANLAKNGAAIVTCPYGGEVKPRKELPKGAGHGKMWDIDDESVQNYFAQLTDAIHFYDSKASISLRVTAPEGYNISAGIMGGMGRNTPGKEVPIEQIKNIIDDTVSQAKFYQTLGFDMVNFHVSYRNTTLAESLSPVLNKRTDQYGGSLENRAFRT
jgi:2,4-dienoyl-CoA reductase-like NADH-dependent reductase (Old Yellow Enzyme family)